MWSIGNGGYAIRTMFAGLGRPVRVRLDQASGRFQGLMQPTGTPPRHGRNLDFTTSYVRDVFSRPPTNITMT